MTTITPAPGRNTDRRPLPEWWPSRHDPDWPVIDAWLAEMGLPSGPAPQPLTCPGARAVLPRRPRARRAS